MSKKKTKRAVTASFQDRVRKLFFADVSMKQPALLAFIAFALFSPTLGFNFVNVDDPKHIDNNPHYTPFTVANVSALWTKPYLIYMPLTYTSWAIDGVIAGPHNTPVATSDGGPSPRFRFQPGVFHFTNVLLHALSCVLVFLILRLWTPAWAAFGGALVFAIHPLQVEPVSWVSARKDTLSGFFALTAMWLYLLSGREKKAKRPLYFGSFACFALAMLAKPPAAMLPGVLAVAAIGLERRPWKKVASELIVYFLAAVPVAVMAVEVQPDDKMPFVPPALSFRPWIALDAIAFYLRKLFYPFEMVLDYGRSPEWLKTSSELRWSPYLGLAFLMLAMAAYFRPRFRWFAWGAAIVVISLSPVLGLKPFVFQTVSTVSDRYMYFVMLGVALVVAKVLEAGLRYKAVGILATALAVLLGIRSYHQEQVWRDSFSLFTHNVTYKPESWLAWNNLGSHFEKTQRWDKAAKYYEMTAVLHPSPLAFNNLGTSYLNTGRPERALAAFKRSTEIDPSSPLDHYNLGLVYQALHQPTEARRSFEKALRIHPGMEPARQALQKMNVENTPH